MSKIENKSITKYKAFKPIELKDRTWPNNQITNSPIWCSVDLRDGNQALIEPMGEERKLRMFKLLLDIGFKEIVTEKVNYEIFYNNISTFFSQFIP